MTRVLPLAAQVRLDGPDEIAAVLQQFLVAHAGDVAHLSKKQTGLGRAGLLALLGAFRIYAFSGSGG